MRPSVFQDAKPIIHFPHIGRTRLRNFEEEDRIEDFDDSRPEVRMLEVWTPCSAPYPVPVSDMLLKLYSVLAKGEVQWQCYRQSWCAAGISRTLSIVAPFATAESWK